MKKLNGVSRRNFLKASLAVAATAGFPTELFVGDTAADAQRSRRMRAPYTFASAKN